MTDNSPAANGGGGSVPEASGAAGSSVTPGDQPPVEQPTVVQPAAVQGYAPYPSAMSSDSQPTVQMPMPPLGDPYPSTDPYPSADLYPNAFGPGHVSTSVATSAEGPGRPRGRGGLVAGAVALALISGGVGGVVGALATHHDNNGTGVIGSIGSGTATDVQAVAPAGSVQAVAQKLLPSVVEIKVAGNEKEGEGSGEILSKDGFILTNNHVASGGGPGAKMTVVFHDGTVAPATLVGGDPVYDIAVIKVAARDNLVPVTLGTSKNLQVGQQVVAIGSPLGLTGTVTTGIVSSLDRAVATSGESGTPDSVIDAIQTDAAINPGNSGGALTDMEGRLVGINTAIASLGSGPDQQSGSIGLGFAIPVDQAKRIADQLISKGRAVHPVIGIMVRGDGDNGAQVDDLTPGGPAAIAGIPKGATVTKVDNRLIASNNALVAAVRAYQPGDKVTVTYTTSGGGAPKTVQVTLATAPDSGR